MPTPSITTRLDQLEASLPAMPARLVRLQRTLAGAAFDRVAGVVGAIAGSTKDALGTGRPSGRTGAGRARSEGRRDA